MAMSVLLHNTLAIYQAETYIQYAIVWAMLISCLSEYIVLPHIVIVWNYATLIKYCTNVISVYMQLYSGSNAHK